MPYSLHGANELQPPPLWAFQYPHPLQWGNTDSRGGSKHGAVHGGLIVSSHGTNPVGKSGTRVWLTGEGEDPATGAGEQWHTPRLWHPRYNRTHANLPSAGKETEGKPAASLCLKSPITWGFGQNTSLVTSKISFIQQDSWPISTKANPHPSVRSCCWNEGKPSYRFICSQTEVLVKHCLRFLDKSSAYLSIMCHSSVHRPQHCTTNWSAWLLFYSGAIQLFFCKMYLCYTYIS